MNNLIFESKLEHIGLLQNRFSTDKITLAILFELGRNQKLLYPELIRDINSDENLIRERLAELEENNFIRQNPSSDKNKDFNERRYLLDLNGLFFLNKLKETFPEFS